MKIFFAILGLSVGMAVAAWGDDMKTLTGQVYTNILVQQYNQDGFVVLHDGGQAEVPFKDIMPELRAHYKALSMIPISRASKDAEKDIPLGAKDLQTRSGKIYRNVTVRQIEGNQLLIAHDRGMETIYFSSLSDPMQERARTGLPVVADIPPGPDDIVTTYGLVFRNTHIIRDEPDGLTFTHDGGVTKLGFPALPEEMGETYHFDPAASWKYRRETAAKKLASQKEPVVEEPTGPASFLIYAIETKKLEDNKHWIGFSVTNLTDETQTIKASACRENLVPMVATKTLKIPPHSVKELQQFAVPVNPPKYLRLTTDTYHTNSLLNWE